MITGLYHIYNVCMTPSDVFVGCISPECNITQTTNSFLIKVYFAFALWIYFAKLLIKNILIKLYFSDYFFYGYLKTINLLIQKCDLIINFSITIFCKFWCLVFVYLWLSWFMIFLVASCCIGQCQQLTIFVHIVIHIHVQ